MRSAVTASCRTYSARMHIYTDHPCDNKIYIYTLTTYAEHAYASVLTFVHIDAFTHAYTAHPRGGGDESGAEELEQVLYVDCGPLVHEQLRRVHLHYMVRHIVHYIVHYIVHATGARAAAPRAPTLHSASHSALHRALHSACHWCTSSCAACTCIAQCST